MPALIASAVVKKSACGEWDEKQRGKAGLYLRLARKERTNRSDFFVSHPLVDAVVVNFPWAELEPEPGKYDFSQIDKILEICRRYDKGLVPAISTYGQSVNRQPTPEWLYNRGVVPLRFHGGGTARGAMITVPKVWDEAFLREYTIFINEFGLRYNGAEGIWYIMPGLGHIGNINAQPSKGGGPAFLSAGWTPEIWTEFCTNVVCRYQRAFPDIPLIVKSAQQLLRNRKKAHYLSQADAILVELAKRRVSVIGFGLEPDIEKIRQNHSVERIAKLNPYTLRGDIRLGLGDDWPLWIPEERRKKSGKFLVDRDEAGLERELQYAFGGVAGLPETHISVLYVLHPEMEACHPENPGRNRRLYKLLSAARYRLKQEMPVGSSADIP